MCSRDYGEISKTPLVSEVSQKVGSLNESAGMLEALSKEKATTAVQLTTLSRERSRLVATESSQVAVEEASTDRARLQIVKQRLDGLAHEAAEATTLIQNAGIAARKLSQARESDDQLSSLIETVRLAATHLKQEFKFPEQPIGLQVSQLLEFAEREETSLNALEEHRTSALSRIQSLQAQQMSIMDLI